MMLDVSYDDEDDNNDVSYDDDDHDDDGKLTKYLESQG